MSRACSQPFRIRRVRARLVLSADWYSTDFNCVWLADDPDLFHGLPVGLQLIGRTQEEEAVIAMTEVVDRALKAQA